MNESIIRAAIQGRKIISFAYGGHKRICEPHVLGTANNLIQVMCFQTGGGSSSGGLPQWRRFDLQKITDLEITGETFIGARQIPQGKHSNWDSVLEVVK